MIYRLIHADVMEGLAQLADASIDAVVTDPPYELGFMNKAWDSSGIARSVAMWSEVLRVLKPGAHLIAFGGTRTYHRMVCAIEDAGFEVRDMLAWIYGSGFPKSHNLSGDRDGWGTALKPAIEPTVLARKPLTDTVAANVLAHGTGALNIDACRVGSEAAGWTGRPSKGLRDTDRKGLQSVEEGGRPTVGRWPANVIHDGSEEVLEFFPDAPGQIADASSSSPSRKTQNVYGAMKRGNGRRSEATAEKRYTDAGGTPFAMTPGARRGDVGSAARFFYTAKASRSERDEGLDGMPERDFGKWSNGDQNVGAFQSPNTSRSARNHHPTVKPIALMRWLVRLITPPGGRVLDLFVGSGSTGMATMIEGFDFTGIDREADYIEIARRRIASVAPMFATEFVEESA